MPPAVRSLPSTFRVRGAILYRELSTIPELTTTTTTTTTTAGANSPAIAPSGGERGDRREEQQHQLLSQATPADAPLRWRGRPLPASLTAGSLLRLLIVPYTPPDPGLPPQLLIRLLRKRVVPYNHLLGRLDGTGQKVIRPRWRLFLPL